MTSDFRATGCWALVLTAATWVAGAMAQTPGPTGGVAVASEPGKAGVVGEAVEWK